MSCFTAAELAQLHASDKAEDGPGYRSGPQLHRRKQTSGRSAPIICKTVRESIASMSPEALAWCIAEGYITEIP